MKKKAVSPVIATALLIAISVIIAGIILVWSRGIIKDNITLNDQPIQQACDEVEIEAGIFINGQNFDFEINNRGQIPINGLRIRGVGVGEAVAVDKNFDESLRAGMSNSFALAAANFPSTNNFELYPILLGERKSRKDISYVCENKMFEEQAR